MSTSPSNCILLRKESRLRVCQERLNVKPSKMRYYITLILLVDITFQWLLVSFELVRRAL